MYHVTIRGLDELQDALEKSPELVEREFKKAMNKSVIKVASEVKRETPVGVSGRLRNSIGSEVTTTASKVRGRVGTSITDEYPIVMEFGRKRGARRPPAARLERWVHLQMGVPTDQAFGVARQVAKIISIRGIKGREMFRKGFEASVKNIEDYFGDALLAIVKELGD
jgi:hypothetical protein